MERLKRRGRLVMFALLFLSAAAVVAFYPFSDVPAHPIDFSHRIHAGVNQIPCQYCHTGARRSEVSGIPPVARCMGCHKIVAVDKPGIVKLRGYYNRGESIPWVRFFDLPDFVYFRHHPHISAGIECQTCHGPVQTYDRFRKAPTLEMGWCIGCHRERGANHDCLACHR